MSYLPDNVSPEYGPDAPLSRADLSLHAQIDADSLMAPVRDRLDVAFHKLDEAQADAWKRGDTIDAAALAAVMRQCAVLIEGVMR